MALYRLLFALDLLAIAALVYIFADSVGYGGLGETAGILVPIIVVPVIVLALAHWLRGKERTGLACVLLGLVAVPALLLVFLLAVMFASGAG